MKNPTFISLALLYFLVHSTMANQTSVKNLPQAESGFSNKQAVNHQAHDEHKQHNDHQEHSDHEEKNHPEHQEPSAEHEGASHEGAAHEESEHQEAAAVHLSAQQQAMAGIVFSPLKRQALSQTIYAPGEIKANGYQSFVVSPRVDSVVILRHVTLGENVVSGQALVSLFSEEMIDAQSNFQQAWVEWQRVEKLGLNAVGEQRFVAVRSRYYAANRRLKAFGLSTQTIEQLSKDKDYPLGEYTLTSKISGVVINDDFNQGQRIEAGQALMLLSDETSLWVEARLPAQNDIQLAAGDSAKVLVDNMLATAVIAQEAHTIDQHTRSRIVRMTLDNREHRFHSGMFADVYFNDGQSQSVLVVPETALMRNAQGHWQIFVADDDGELMAKNVVLGQRFGDWQQISGVAEGVSYVSQGAFFVASELAKGGFDPHNH